ARADFRNNWWGHPGGPHDPSVVDGESHVNPAGQSVTDFVQYQPYLIARPQLPIGPAVFFVTPVAVNQTVTSIDIEFSELMNLATFTGADVSISGPRNAQGNAVTHIGGNRYR